MSEPSKAAPSEERLFSDDDLRQAEAACIALSIGRLPLDSEMLALIFFANRRRVEKKERAVARMAEALKEFMDLPNVTNRIGPWRDVNESFRALKAALKAYEEATK